MRALLDRAARSGIDVSIVRLPGDLLGCYLPEVSRIYLDDRLTPIELRSVLAHELAHAHLGHGRAQGDERRRQAEERQADVYAARMLIAHRDYARAERISDDPAYLADELGVTEDLLEVYRSQCLTRVRGGVWAQSAVPV